MTTQPDPRRRADDATVHARAAAARAAIHGGPIPGEDPTP
ncbi:hypothetical protein CLV72_109205 [Allonocardiopsis opalescens]|uniref:Uncharacterized protein n=1 Tax=Allonocardiopsis opalescens TaxID=1144618 RepID=A0A2T0PVM4_9ACTN|nr:hypothetical protein CLV72_109205 [Allonocardiopsis opalescens]